MCIIGSLLLQNVNMITVSVGVFDRTVVPREMSNTISRGVQQAYGLILSRPITLRSPHNEAVATTRL